jgi:hypothetical protein
MLLGSSDFQQRAKSKESDTTIGCRLFARSKKPILCAILGVHPIKREESGTSPQVVVN